MRARTKVTFTPEELETIAAVTRQGAAAIAKMWDILKAIGERQGCDWNPKKNSNSVSELFDLFAVDISCPDDTAFITPALVKKAFIDPDNWSKL
ncbi:MAG TPA: hypothetical protein VFK06_24595 [Candidatus Angelobacter sp.]|nr:hypothetical protein [Candidatus Angelobacter sp.]